MKKLNYGLGILATIVVLLLFPIVMPVLEEETVTAEVENARENAKTIDSNQLIFNLKYDKYRIPYPYKYEYKGEVRTFEFQEMIDRAKVAVEEFEKGQLTYISNYKDENGKAPLYYGKTLDKDGTLRGAAAPAYKALDNMAEFDYLPDGTLVRIIERSAGGSQAFVKVYSIKDQEEYYIANKYVELGRSLDKVSKVIVVDLKNQTIAALENNPKSLFFEAANAYLNTEWEIVSYSKCTTGKLGLYQQPTPEGFFYAMEKKPFFYYLKDGTNIVAGSEPWAIRFTAGAYVHGMSLGEYSAAIGTTPLSHKCVRNYTSHAKFLYDWYEKDKTIVVVI